MLNVFNERDSYLAGHILSIENRQINKGNSMCECCVWLYKSVCVQRLCVHSYATGTTNKTACNLVSRWQSADCGKRNKTDVPRNLSEPTVERKSVSESTSITLSPNSLAKCKQNSNKTKPTSSSYSWQKWQESKSEYLQITSKSRRQKTGTRQTLTTFSNSNNMYSAWCMSECLATDSLHLMHKVDCSINIS